MEVSGRREKTSEYLFALGLIVAESQKKELRRGSSFKRRNNQKVKKKQKRYEHL